MNEEMIKSKVYIKTDNQNRIIYCDGGFYLKGKITLAEYSEIVGEV